VEKKENPMSIVKIIEVISEGKTVDAAMSAAVKEAALTIDGINQINVKHIEGIVKNGKIEKVRINASLSFVVNHPKGRTR